jgi:hypothetical protein
LGVFRSKTAVNGWKVTSFDIELLHLAERRKLEIKEVAVDWEDRDLAKDKNKNYLNESKEMLIEILKVKWNDLKGLYTNPNMEYEHS